MKSRDRLCLSMLCGLLLWLGMNAAAHPALPACGHDITAVNDMTPPDVADHRLFDLKPFVLNSGRNATLSYRINLIVGQDGVPLCADSEALGIAFDDTGDALPDAVRAAIAGWRYRPFTTGDRPANTYVSEYITTTRPPLPPRTMPQAPLFTSTITFMHSNCRDHCPMYTVELKGDGRAVFTGEADTDVVGRLDYKVPPGEVAALIERLRGRGVWAMQDAYVGASPDGLVLQLKLAVGGQTKSVLDYQGGDVGAPPDLAVSEDDVAETAGVDRWIHLTPDSLQALENSGFDFASQRGADLLVSIMNSRTAGDDIVKRIIDHGAPLTGGYVQANPPDGPKTGTNALTLAIAAERDAVIDDLMSRNVLFKDGRPDPSRIDDAFVAALGTGRLDYVTRFLAFHPAMTRWVDGDDETGKKTRLPVSVAFDLRQSDDEAHAGDVLPILRLLVAHGANLTGHDDDGDNTLLMTVGDRDVATAQYLLDLGVPIDARNIFEATALTDTSNEDVALLLLDRGADTNARDMMGATIFSHVRAWRWTRVEAWLAARGRTEPVPAS